MTPPDKPELATRRNESIASRPTALAGGRCSPAIGWRCSPARTGRTSASADIRENTDKLLHFSAYAGLSFLIALRLAFKRARAAGESLRLPRLRYAMLVDHGRHRRIFDF